MNQIKPGPFWDLHARAISCPSWRGTSRSDSAWACRSLAGPLDPRLQRSVRDEELDWGFGMGCREQLASLHLFVLCCAPVSALPPPPVHLAPTPLITSRYGMGYSISCWGRLGRALTMHFPKQMLQNWQRSVRIVLGIASFLVRERLKCCHWIVPFCSLQIECLGEICTALDLLNIYSSKTWN